MSVQNLKSPDAWTCATFEGRAASCFHCGDDINDVAVVWNGCMGEDADSNLISLHPDCAIHLAIDLIRDATTARNIMTGKSLKAGVDASLLSQGEA